MTRAAIVRSFAVAVAALSISPATLHAAPTIGATAAQPSSVSVNTPVSVTVTAAIADSSLLPQSVNLLKVDAAGRVLANLGVMVDNGTNGDLTAGDKTFSRAIAINESTLGSVRFQVSAAFRGVMRRALSPPIVVEITARRFLPVVSTAETAASASATIPIEGGEVSAIGSDGVVYSLQVPFGALIAPTAITITPLTNVTSLPVSGPIVGAVRLAPAGLALQVPATLVVTLPGPVPAGGLVALHHGTGATDFEAPATTIAGTTLTSTIAHFSDEELVLAQAAEYAELILDLVQSLPAQPSLLAVQNLMDFVTSGTTTYTPAFCSLGPNVCQVVYDGALAALDANLASTSATVQALIAAEDPYAAYDALAGVFTLAVEVGELYAFAGPTSRKLPAKACPASRVSSILSVRSWS